MVQNVVVGTLATLNMLMSPLSPSELSRHSYQFDLEPNSLLNETCLLKSGPERSHLSLSLDGIANESFTLDVKAKFCAAGEGLRTVAMTLSLPVEILDETFITNLKPNLGYMIGGIPSSTNPGKKERVKVTRLARQGELEPILIEWIPALGFEPASPPVTIWMDLAHSRFSEGPRKTSRTLPWKRVRLSYKAPLVSRSYVLTGDLKGIDARR